MTDGTPVALPFAQRPRRLQVAGRLRTGVKGNGGPRAIDTWRITTHDKEALDQLAEMYGGTVRPWRDAPTAGQWELFTEATTLRVVLPPDPLGDGPIYELWSGKGRQRRCDATTCETFRSGPDGPEPVEVPCICNAKGKLECKPKTRLQVMLPGIRFSGVWRYDSGSGNVADELAGMVYEVLGGIPRGFIEAELCLENRRGTVDGQVVKYTIPVLRIATSLEGLAAGEVPVLGAGTPTPAPLAIEAAVVDTRAPGQDAAPVGELGSAPEQAKPSDPDRLASWVELSRRLPQLLNGEADGFKQWMKDENLRWKPTVAADLERVITEARRRYQLVHGGPHGWAPAELAEARRLIDELRPTRDWVDFTGVAFENLADPDRPESWTDSQLTILSTWIRLDVSTPPSSNEGSDAHDHDRSPVPA